MSNVNVEEVIEVGRKYDSHLIPFQSEKMREKGIIMFGNDSKRDAQSFAEAVHEKLGLNSWWRESQRNDGAPYLVYATKTPAPSSELVF